MKKNKKNFYLASEDLLGEEAAAVDKRIRSNLV
jgi:hypothetical protein